MQGSTHIAGLANNIILDGASAYKWEVLNETVFLTKFFECLRESMGAEFFSYTFYILSSHDPEILPQSAADASRRKILFFISDESSSVPVALQSHYLAIFKSYLPHELPGSNIFPFNIGYVRDVPEIMPKPIQSRANNVFFSGNMNNNRFPLYRELHPILKRLPYRIAKALFYGMQRGRRHLSKETDFGASFPKSYIRFTDGFKHGLSPESYGRMLYDSKIVLCPRGFSSSETFRHMEALRAGAIVISERLPDTHFYRGSPIVSVRDWRAGLEMARQIIADPKLLEGLHLETTKWWHRICSEAATATYIKNQLHQLERVRLPDDS